MAATFGDTCDETSLFDRCGQRKYLSDREARRFLAAAAASADPRTRILCQLLSYTGCRISEALELTPRRLDRDGARIVFRTLKRRRRIFRAVPVPAAVMRDLLALAHGRGLDERLWPWSRQTGWRRIKQVMQQAAIDGPQAMPRGLRHQFGVRAAQTGMPIALTQRWMGHASPKTTAIYQQAIGQEERRMARRMWRGEAGHQSSLP